MAEETDNPLVAAPTPSMDRMEAVFRLR